MMRLSKKVEYALLSLQHLSAVPAEEVATAREIADVHRIPPEILGKVLQALMRAEMVESVQGAKGGYRLPRPLTQMTLGQVIEAVDGPVHVVPCTGDHYNCDQEAACTIKRPIILLQAQLQSFVFSLTLDTLCQPTASDQPVRFNLASTGGDHVLL
jgi:Rrf2 family transcriptional regulator, cysteine metabolism repressor